MTPPDAPVPSERDRLAAVQAMRGPQMTLGDMHTVAIAIATARAEGYAAGFADARDRAAGECDDLIARWQESEDDDARIAGMGAVSCADRIRALTPERGRP